MDTIMGHVAGVAGGQIGDMRLTDFDYADDVAVLADNEGKIHEGGASGKTSTACLFALKRRSRISAIVLNRLQSLYTTRPLMQ